MKNEIRLIIFAEVRICSNIFHIFDLFAWIGLLFRKERGNCMKLFRGGGKREFEKRIFSNTVK